jgi:hypothetical protein
MRREEREKGEKARIQKSTLFSSSSSSSNHRRRPPRANAAALAAPHAAYIQATFQQLLTAALRCAS